MSAAYHDTGPDRHAQARALLHRLGVHAPYNDHIVAVVRALRDAYLAGRNDARREQEQSA